MPLNEQSLLNQIQKRAGSLQTFRDNQDRDLPLAIEQYRQQTRAGWLSLEELARAKQVAALPVEELTVCRQISRLALPDEGSYVVVATDGSIIPPDRHGGLAFCQVLNVGEVVLGYGQRQMAHIDADTRLYLNGIEVSPAAEKSESAESEADYEDDNASSQALLLEAEMSVAELEVALRLAGDYWATLALRDGPLTLWTSSILNSKEGRAITGRYLALVGKFAERGIPIIGYTSNTRSDVVMTALRVMGRQPYRGLLDANLFGAILAAGECSPVFRHSARHPKDAALTEQIRFMYLNTGDEIVRLEFSQDFVDTPQLETALSIIWQQVQLGLGYPTVLMEAHESAVLRQYDRELLFAAMESYGLVGQQSQKGLSKRLRNV